MILVYLGHGIVHRIALGCCLNVSASLSARGVGSFEIEETSEHVRAIVS